MATDGPIDQDSVAWRTLMQAALESMDEGFSVFDLNLRLLAWNMRFLEQYGIPDSYAQVGTRFEDLMRLNAQRGEYGPGDIEQLVAERVALARQFIPHAFERTMADGRVFEIRGNPIPGIGFVTVYKEVTERRRAQLALEESRQQLEARVRERTAELQASEDWIRRVADAVPVLIGYVDASRRYRFANRLHEDWFGLSAERIIGRPVEQILGAALDAGVEQHIEAALAGREVSHEFPLTGQSGREIVAAVSYRPHFCAQGEVLGYFVLGLDVTEQRHAEAILRQGQKMQAVGQLTGGLAHDFNNLLAIVIGNLALAVDQVGIERETRTLIEPALDGARRGAALVRRLLAFARQQPIAPEIYNAEQVVAGMEELLQRTLGGSIRIDMRLGGEPCLIRADPNELENAVLNLAINSRDAMPTGGRLVLSIDNETLRAGKAALPQDPTTGDYVVIAVTDTGFGMPRDVVERAFEPFFTTKQFGGGSGLGLSMVYGFARRSGGKAEIDSEPGRGTTVRIYLPRIPASEAALAETGPIDQQAPKGRERVLVVEDEPAVRELAMTMLRRLGYEVAGAQDGRTALEALERTGADLILTDVDLPGGMNGIELARTARQRLPALAVLLMSGFPDKVLGQVRDDDEHHDPIAKPFELPELARRVRAMLDGAAGRCRPQEVAKP
jgi:PAS domain S-box-containing protein